MEILRFFITIYLVLGGIYATYTYMKEPKNWVMLPINIMFGPIILLYIVYMSLRGKKLPTDW